jgi:uncharacterized protein involved in exopolysaccharide biosynthesis
LKSGFYLKEWRLSEAGCPTLNPNGLSFPHELFVFLRIRFALEPFLPHTTEEDQELDIRTTILFVKKVWALLNQKSNRLKIIGVAVVFSALGFLMAWMKPVLYKAEAAFIAEETSKGGGLTSMISLASQLGLGGGGGKDNSEKLIEMLKSRRIFESAMLDSAVVLGKSDWIINHYLDLSSFGKGLRGNETFAEFRFGKNPTQKRVQDSILMILHEDMHKVSIKTESKKSSSMLKLQILTEHEELSKAINSAMLTKLNEYYVETTVARQKNMFNILQNRADSLRAEIEFREKMMARTTDENMLSFRMEQKVDALRLKREIQVNNLVYAEVIKNLEMARANLLNETPVLSVIDEAVLPLEKVKPAKKYWLAGGFVLGALLTVIYILILAWWKSLGI